MFFITLCLKPIAKFFLKNPVLGGLLLAVIYVYIAQRCLQSAWEHGWGRTPTNLEVANRWQQRMAYSQKRR